MQIIREVTEHVTGLPSQDAAITGGDPSPFTAYGVFLGIKAAVKHKLKKNTLENARVAVSGLGHVGMDLCRRLHEAGAKLIVCDIRPEATQMAVEKYDAMSWAAEEFIGLDVDVLAPCALGGILNEDSIGRIKAPIIAGAANNQLKRPEHGVMLHDAGILYAPD